MIIKKITRWIFFSVIIAFLPIIFKLFVALIQDSPDTYINVFYQKLNEIYVKGELLLLSSALCAAAIGELFGAPSAFAVTKIIAGGVATIVIIIASFCFAYLDNMTQNQVRLDAIETISVCMLVASFISSGACIILSEL